MVTFSACARCCGDFPPKRPTDPVTGEHPAANGSFAGRGCRAATLSNAYYDNHIFIHCNSFFFPILDRPPPPFSLASHTLPLLVLAQGEDIMYHHSEDGEYKMPPRHRLYASGATCFFVFFSPSLPLFPSPRRRYIMLCSHRRWFCVFAGWMETFSGLASHHRNAGEMTELGAMKRSPLTLIVNLSFRFWADFIFQGGGGCSLLKCFISASISLTGDLLFPFCQSPGLS